MEYEITGVGTLTLKTLILDLNGTLTVNGRIPTGTKYQLDQLKKLGYAIVFFTGNTRGNADETARLLGVEWQLAETAGDKKEKALALDPDTCVAIGNGRIDLELMKVVKLGIVVVQAEGAYVPTVMAADVLIPTITDALDFLLNPQTLIATLRR